MKIKVKIVNCTHETKHGIDSFVRTVKKNENVSDVIEAIKEQCDYNEDDPNYGEFFDSDISEITIDTNDFEIVE